MTIQIEIVATRTKFTTKEYSKMSAFLIKVKRLKMSSSNRCESESDRSSQVAWEEQSATSQLMFLAVALE